MSCRVNQSSLDKDKKVLMKDTASIFLFSRGCAVALSSPHPPQQRLQSTCTPNEPVSQKTIRSKLNWLRHRDEVNNKEPTNTHTRAHVRTTIPVCTYCFSDWLRSFRHGLKHCSYMFMSYHTAAHLSRHFRDPRRTPALL